MQQKDILLTNRHFTDLNPILLGEHVCDCGYGTQPAIRKHTLIHYVFQGKGTLFSGGNAYPVTAGQAFLIRQGEVANYRADESDPWYYCWIGFDGVLSSQFDRLPSVFSAPETVFQRMLRTKEDPAVMEYRLVSELFRLYALLLTTPSKQSRHVRQVESYIRHSYMLPIRVESIARQMNLDRRYLSRLFKKETGSSIQEYILTVRMEEAANYLQQGFSVKETAHMVGYEDVSNFSKLFKRCYRQSPAQMRTTL